MVVLGHQQDWMVVVELTLAGEKVRLAYACAGYPNISTPYIIHDLPLLTPVNYINLHVIISLSGIFYTICYS